MKHEYYKSSDMGEASSLHAGGFRVVNVDKSNPKRVFFVFEKTNELETSINRYWSGDLKLPANTLISSIKYLKVLIYA